ncbi:SDR family oxidoreductase [Streptomyces bullii]
METTTDFLEESFRFNVSGAHALTTAAAPYMLEAGGGAIVNISSLVGRVAGRGWAAYGTAKAALSHYTRLAALDLAPRIRVTAIEPGSIATSVLDGVSTPEIIEKLESAIPLRRMGDPEHIAATVLYLVSPAGAYVTGKILEVDGGSQLPPPALDRRTCTVRVDGPAESAASSAFSTQRHARRSPMSGSRRLRRHGPTLRRQGARRHRPDPVHRRARRQPPRRARGGGAPPGTSSCMASTGCAATNHTPACSGPCPERS